MNKTVKIGRGHENNIVFQNDMTVSREHATLFINGNDMLIRDNGSSNGTFINGNRVYGENPIYRNDILKVGNALVPWMNCLGDYNPQRATTQVVSDNSNHQSGNQNYSNQNESFSKLTLSGTGIVLTLGILSLVLAGIIGMVLGIIAVSKGNGIILLVESNPGKYNESNLGQAKAGKICGIIGIVLSSLIIFYYILLIAAYASVY